MNTGNVVLVIVFVLLMIMIFFKNLYREHMAPLGFGSYKNDYTYGKCNAGDFKRTDCMVGNCPIGSNISDEEYCYIQCAQGVGEQDYRECYDHCKGMMGNCR